MFVDVICKLPVDACLMDWLLLLDETQNKLRLIVDVTMLFLLKCVTGHCTSNNLLPFTSGYIHVLNKVFIIISSVLLVTIITHETFHQSLTSLVFCTVSLVYPANKKDPPCCNPTMVLASQN